MNIVAGTLAIIIVVVKSNTSHSHLHEAGAEFDRDRLCLLFPPLPHGYLHSYPSSTLILLCQRESLMMHIILHKGCLFTAKNLTANEVQPTDDELRLLVKGEFIQSSSRRPGSFIIMASNLRTFLIMVNMLSSLIIGSLKQTHAGAYWCPQRALPLINQPPS